MNAEKSTTKSGRHKGVIAMILFLCPVCAFAQHKADDVVYLKNGSIIYGSLSPVTDSNYITLQTGNNDVWTIPRSDVIKSGRAKTVFPVKKAGWYSTSSFGLFFGDDKGYQVESVVGYRFLYRYYAGVGAAIDDYSFRAIPVFASFKADLWLRKTTPFLYANTGIAYPWLRSGAIINGGWADKSEKKGGWYFDAGIGQKLRIDDRHSLHLSIGYSLERFRFIFGQKDNSNPNTETEVFITNTYSYSFNRLVLKLGFTL